MVINDAVLAPFGVMGCVHRSSGALEPKLVDELPCGGSICRNAEVCALRTRVLDHVRAQGFKITSGRIVAPIELNKDRLRALHAGAVADQRERARPALERHEGRFITRLIRGTDLDPRKIRPRLVLVTDRTSFDALAWRWCAAHWSIPVSGGYGRRLRFLIQDEGHDNKLIGLIGLGDPVFALGCRDSTIGWDRNIRKERLVNVMDAFVLGAVPPYDRLLGGKLAALLAGSEEVREAFDYRYGHRKTQISDRDPNAKLALVTTSSALGRSSVYNRITRPDGNLALRAVGYTAGTGDFHLSGSIYDELASFASAIKPPGTGTERHPRWRGKSFRNRREVIHRALEGLGLDSRALRIHGVRRQVFLYPLAANSYPWLRGEERHLDWHPGEVDDLSRWWRQRWAIPRSEREETWLNFEPNEWFLYKETTSL
jgi:hypothetical protein